MGQLKVGDFFYGAAVSNFFKSKAVVPALVDDNPSRRIYSLTTDRGDFLLYLKYRSIDGSSTSFTFSAKEHKEIKKYISNQDQQFYLGLIMVDQSNLSKSQIAVLNENDINELLIVRGKNSFTLWKSPKKRTFSLSLDGSRRNVRPIPYTWKIADDLQI